MSKNSLLTSLALYFFILTTCYFLYHNISLSLFSNSLNYQQKKSLEIVFIVTFSAIFWSYQLIVLIKKSKSKVHNNQHLLQISEALIQNSTNVLFHINSSGYLTFISPMCYSVLGYREIELTTKPLSALFLEAFQYESIKDQMTALNMAPHCLRAKLVCKDGRHIETEIRTVLYQTKTGVELQGCIEDLSEQSIMLASLQEKQHMLNNIVDNLPYLIFVKNDKNETILANQFLCEFTGFNSDFLLKSNVSSEANDPLEAMLPSRFVKHVIHKPRYKKELLDSLGIMHEVAFSQIKIEPENKTNLTLIIGKLLSVSEKRTQSLEHLLQYDPLTGLLNRNVFINRLDKYISSVEAGTLTAICVVDLSNFKRINDTLGHEVGDQALKFASQKISLLGESLCMLCRYNGDEFAFVLKNIKAMQQLTLQLEKLHELFDSPLKLYGIDVKLALNIGAVICPDDGLNTDELLKKLGIALHVAKSSSAVRTQLYVGELEETLQINMRIEKHLTYALEKSEFRLVFQPFINNKHNKLMGAEVLLRWHNDELGEVYPDQFIPVAEQTGDIVAIGSWIIEQACLQLKSWEKLFGDDFYLAVNVSPRQFLYGDLVNVVDAALLKHGIKAQSLEIEITEGLLISDQELVLNIMQSLVKRGVRLSLDDFGTGYSSLNYLKKFPFNCLKIDRAFITDINNDKQNDALVVAITEMAHALNLSVVAEGVEELAQLTRLKALSVDITQGYYFSKPLPCREFECWHKQNKGNHLLTSVEG